MITGLNLSSDSGEFPTLPEKTVTWSPVYLEPVMASGERITIGVAFQNGGGIEFHRTLEKRQLKTLFGTAADNVLGLIEMVHAGVIGCPSLKDAVAPISGAYFGQLHEIHAETLEEVIETSMAMSSAFVALPEHGADDDEEVEKDVRTQVMEGVESRRPGLKSYFNKTVKLSQKSDRPLRFAFAGNRAAVNIGTLNPNNNFSTYLDKAKARILDLSNLRMFDQEHNIERLGGTAREHYDMIVFHPGYDSPLITKKSKENLRSALVQLEEEGNNHEIRVEAMTAASKAVDWILWREAA